MRRPCAAHLPLGRRLRETERLAGRLHRGVGIHRHWRGDTGGAFKQNIRHERPRDRIGALRLLLRHGHMAARMRARDRGFHLGDPVGQIDAYRSLYGAYLRDTAG